MATVVTLGLLALSQLERVSSATTTSFKQQQQQQQKKKNMASVISTLEITAKSTNSIYTSLHSSSRY